MSEQQLHNLLGSSCKLPPLIVIKLWRLERLIKWRNHATINQLGAFLTAPIINQSTASICEWICEQTTNIYDSHAKFRLKMTQKNMHKQIIQRNFLPLLVFVSFFMSCLMRKLCFFPSTLPTNANHLLGMGCANKRRNILPLMIFWFYLLLLWFFSIYFSASLLYDKYM